MDSSVPVTNFDLNHNMDLEQATTNTLDYFKETSETEVGKIIKSSKSTTCSLDPLPTKIIKKTSSAHIPALTRLINTSFESGIVPVPLKKALVTPILKKHGLDVNILANYRPVSNLPFTAKVMEKIAVQRISEHLTSNGLHEELQSAYKPLHSTETALMRVQHDIANAMDTNQAALLVLLDMSAAFDTIDANILIYTLHNRLGVKGTPLKWFRSYLSDRCFAVKVGNSQSPDHKLKYGVPQGSVIGHFLFTVYSAATEAILKKHGIKYHKYADDIQIYLFYRPHVPGDLVCAIYRLQACFRELKQLLTTLKLKLNDCKTEFLVLMSPHQLRKYGLPDLQLGTVLIKPAVSVRNLGAHFDQMLTMVNFINHKIKVASYHLRRIGSIRKYITDGICHKLVVALVTSNIDYCNGLLGGLAAKDVDRLQRLQNRTARLVTRSKAAMHITPIRKDLHWLPIQKRINYKIIVTVYKCIHRLAPNYLSSILTTRTRDNRLRQKQVCHELNTHSCAKVVGKQAFGTRAPEQIAIEHQDNSHTAIF